MSNESPSRQLHYNLQHPLLTSEILLPTKPIEELCDAVVDTVQLRIQGVYYSECSGMGKTSALTFIAAEVERKFPGVVIVIHDARNHQAPSIRAFYKDFLTTVGTSDTKGETPDLRNRLINRLVGQARTNGRKLVVLLIDEAQTLRVSDFEFLKDTGNALTREGIGFITVLMAQEPEFSGVVEELIKNKKLDLISRFALTRGTFRTLSTLEDIQHLLGGVDQATWQESKEETWTQHFLPQLWDAGFRLESEAKTLFSIIDKMATDAGLTHAFPARQLFTAVRCALTGPQKPYYESSDGSSFGEGLWRSSLKRAAFLEAAIAADAGRQKTNGA